MSHQTYHTKVLFSSQKKRMDAETRKLAIRLGAAIRAQRAKAGMSQIRLGEITGMEQAHISRLETGRAEPCLGTLRMIAKAFGITLAELFKGL